MTFGRWLGAIGLLTVLGCVQVAVRHDVFQRGYALGSRAQRVHAQEGWLTWLDVKIEGMRSPVRLSGVARQRDLKLVAWSVVGEREAPALLDRQALDAAPGADSVRLASAARAARQASEHGQDDE